MTEPKPYKATRGLEGLAILEAERAGEAFFVHRNLDGELLVTPVVDSPATLGRGAANTVALTWDERVSRVHAEVSRRGPSWTITDSGLSLNGTFVNERAIEGRTRLEDGDEIRIGDTEILFRVPVREEASEETITTVPPPPAPELSDAQRAVLDALASAPSGGASAPPGNAEIAERLGVSIDAVKGHMRHLTSKFGLGELPPDERRIALIERAIAAGVLRLPPADASEGTNEKPR